LLPLFVSLGLWQLDRAEQKQQVQQHMFNNMQQPRFELLAVPTASDDMMFRQVEVAGQFDKQHYLLDNRTWRGQAGYDVLTPFRYSGGVILVNRGWIGMTPDRNRLPEFATAEGPVRLVGVLAGAPGKLLELGNSARLDIHEQHWPQVVQQVDIARMSEQLGYTMAPLLLHLEADSPHGFTHDWIPYVDRAEKSISYAMQWFSFAIILLLLFFALNMKRIKQDDGE
jgi:surfeit locus 1 family protein